jgi:hypothetical protein
MKSLCLLFVFTLTTVNTSIAQESVVQVPQAPVTTPAAPVILVPTIRYLPYQYKGTTIRVRQFQTPLRDLMFGRYRIQHHFVPQAQ